MASRFLVEILALVIVSFVVLGMVSRVRRTRWLRKWLATATNAVMEPYGRGDYEAALQAAEGLRMNGEITRLYCYFRGANLAHLGRLDEAEAWLRRNIAMQPKGKQRLLAVALTTLGHLMLHAGRYEEAQECFETSMRHFPGRGSAYRSMAELCLLRRGNPAEAMRWAKLAMDREQADRGLTAEIRKTNRGENLAILAWSTAAATHDHSEVARLATEAVESVGASGVTSTAQVHYHLGRAYAVVGDVPASSRHYQEAGRLDSQGNWGRAAHAAMTSGTPAG